MPIGLVFSQVDYGHALGHLGWGVGVEVGQQPVGIARIDRLDQAGELPADRGVGNRPAGLWRLAWPGWLRRRAGCATPPVATRTPVASGAAHGGAAGNAGATET